MDWNTVITFLVGGGLGGVIAAYIAIRKLPGEARKMNVDAAAVASKALIDILNATQAERAAYAAERAAASKERESLVRRVDTMEAEQETHRMVRDAEIADIKNEHKSEIDELKARIQSDLMDTRELRIEHADKEKRVNKLEDMVIKMSNYIDTMKQAMQKADIPVPLNGELLESARRLRLSVEERERLKAGK